VAQQECHVCSLTWRSKQFKDPKFWSDPTTRVGLIESHKNIEYRIKMGLIDLRALAQGLRVQIPHQLEILEQQGEQEQKCLHSIMWTLGTPYSQSCKERMWIRTSKVWWTLHSLSCLDSGLVIWHSDRQKWHASEFDRLILTQCCYYMYLLIMSTPVSKKNHLTFLTNFHLSQRRSKLIKYKKKGEDGRTTTSSSRVEGWSS